jgi:hypothetical protein
MSALQLVSKMHDEASNRSQIEQFANELFIEIK